jgi:hypothetical protein
MKILENHLVRGGAVRGCRRAHERCNLALQLLCFAQAVCNLAAEQGWRGDCECVVQQSVCGTCCVSCRWREVGESGDAGDRQAAVVLRWRPCCVKNMPVGVTMLRLKSRFMKSKHQLLHVSRISPKTSG